MAVRHTICVIPPAVLISILGDGGCKRHMPSDTTMCCQVGIRMWNWRALYDEAPAIESPSLPAS